MDIEGDETDDEFNTSDIDFNADYSDDGNSVPIDERNFWEYLQKLEEHNLFEMTLLQENTQTLEKMERESAETLAARRRKIDELDPNIK